MRKTRRTKATYDAIGSLDPAEAGELLSAGLNSSMIDRKIHETIDWKNHEFDPSDIYIGDPPNTLGNGGSILGGNGSIEIGKINPSIVIGGSGSTTTVDGVSITELEKRVADLEKEVADLKDKAKKGGFRGKPKI